jgi:hypothetical protein
MRLPSIQYLAGEARAVVRRFPMVMVAAVVAAAAGIAATEVGDEAPLVRVMVTAQLAFPLFFALAVAAESNRWSRGRRVLWVVAAVVALVAYGLTLPDRMRPGAVTRFLQFNIGLHLLAAFLPFARGGRHNGFWQYNRALFLRFLVAVLYSAVIYLGLTLALFALDQLLGVPMPERVYLWLLIVTLFVFNTWVFLGGVPRDVAALDLVNDYPRALKVFAQYILIPLVVTYLAILTVYLVKVVVTTEWPSGWIGYLVSSVAVVGILALLLVWPVAGRSENRWVATYTRWFFIFMIPAIVMLLLAIAKRIGQYGVTENRYFLAVLALWLAAIAVYFIVSRARRIKVIPVTLCVVVFATSFGPWGAYSVARRSQTARLEALMEANGILSDGAIVKTAHAVSLDDRREISAITQYLVAHHGRDTFDRWVDSERVEPMDSTVSYGPDQDVARAIVLAMGIDYVDSWARAPGAGGRFNYTIDRNTRVFELDDADYMVRLDGVSDRHALGDGGYEIRWQDGVVLADGAGVVAAAPVDSVLARIERDLSWNARSVPVEVMRMAAEGESVRLVVYYTLLGGVTRDGSTEVNRVNADCFVSLP